MMLDLYYWPTPNGWKTTIMLEECGLPYRLKPVAIDRGQQDAPSFRAVSPNGRIPALVDHEPTTPGPPIAIFESGAILLYLAEKTGRFLPDDPAGRWEVIQWLMWQMSGLGPTLGQNDHFLLYAETREPYAIQRFGAETARLYGMLDRRLGETADCVAGPYSIADIAIFPWVMTHKRQGVSLAEYPNVGRWFSTLRERPRLQAGLAAGKALRRDALDAEARRALFDR